MTVLLVLLTIAVCILAVLVAGLLQSHAAILRRLHELGAGLETADVPLAADLPAAAGKPAGVERPAGGRRAADLVGTDPEGNAVGIAVADVDHDTVIAFLSTTCAACDAFWDTLTTTVDLGLPPDTRLVVVTDDSGGRRSLPPRVGGTRIVRSPGAWSAYAVPGAPYFVHVEGATGVIRGEGTGGDWPGVRNLLRQTAGSAAGARKAGSDARRERDVDAVLLASGIRPGDPSLYPTAHRPGTSPQGR